MASKYDWNAAKRGGTGVATRSFSRTQQAQNLEETDPRNIERGLAGTTGTGLARMVAEQVAETLRQLGMTSVDRRHLAFPEADTRNQAFDERDLNLRCDNRSWDNPNIRERRYEVLRGFYRHSLFKTPLADALPGISATMVRALSTTDSAGGYLIPPGYIYEVMRDVPKLTQLFPYVRKVPVVGDSGIFPKVGANARAYWGTESSDIQQGDPAFADTAYTINRLNVIEMLSREIVTDSNPAIVEIVTELMREVIAEEVDRGIAIGTGTGNPQGIYGASGITDLDSVTTLTWINLVKLKESIDQRYQGLPSMRWMFNQQVKAAIMEIEDGFNRPLFVTSTNNQLEPGMLLGIPYSIERTFPDNFIGVGCLNYYVWFDRQQLGIESTTEGGDAFLKHQMWIKLFLRADGRVVIPPTVPFARSTKLSGITDLGSAYTTYNDLDSGGEGGGDGG